MLAQRSGEAAARFATDPDVGGAGRIQCQPDPLCRRWHFGDGRGIHSVAASMSEIANSSNEQSTGLKEISGAVQQLDQITQDNAQMVGLAVQQAEALEQRASTLNRAVAAFRLQQGTAEEAVALVRKGG